VDWVSVKDRLPKPYHEEVSFTYDEAGDIRKDTCYPQHNEWVVDGPMSSYGPVHSPITHWMGYPKPPRDS